MRRAAVNPFNDKLFSMILIAESPQLTIPPSGSAPRQTPTPMAMAMASKSPSLTSSDPALF